MENLEGRAIPLSPPPKSVKAFALGCAVVAAAQSLLVAPNGEFKGLLSS